MDPNPVSALAMTARLAAADEALDLHPAEPSAAPDVDRADESVQTRAKRPQEPLSDAEGALLDRLLILAGASAFVVDECATIAGVDVATIVDLFGRIGVVVQDRGVVDGAALERALSVDGLTAIERMAADVAARITSAPVDYEPTSLADTEGVYSLARVLDRGGDPWA
jgi:hypothetical protein